MASRVSGQKRPRSASVPAPAGKPAPKQGQQLKPKPTGKAAAGKPTPKPTGKPVAPGKQQQQRQHVKGKPKGAASVLPHAKAKQAKPKSRPAAADDDEIDRDFDEDDEEILAEAAEAVAEVASEDDESDFVDDDEDEDEDQEFTDSESEELEEAAEERGASSASERALEFDSDEEFYAMQDDHHPFEQDPDSSDDEQGENKIGDVPLKWYEEYEHYGYDIEGKKLMRPDRKDAIDSFLDHEDGSQWRRVWDEKNQKEILISKEQMQMLRRMQQGKFPDPNFNPYDEMIETPGDHIHPLLNTPEPKRRFIPSKWEAKKIAYLVKAIRKGWIKVGEDESANRPKRTEFKLMWADDNKVIGGDDSKAAQRRQAIHIPAPRKRLPGHAESYRPPPEYLLSEEERAKWDDHEHRAGAFMGKSHNSMREIGLFDKLFQETFERCLDLYLCPRATVMRHRVESADVLLPKLPSTDELRPFPTKLTVAYLGHAKNTLIRSISPDPTGQFLASGSDDGTVRVWEVSTGRCLGVFNLRSKAQLASTPEEDETHSDSEADDSDQEDADTAADAENAAKKEGDDSGEPASDTEVEASANKTKTKRTEKTIIMSVNWNPNPAIPILAVAVGRTVVLLNLSAILGFEGKPEAQRVQDLLRLPEDHQQPRVSGEKKRSAPLVLWEQDPNSEYDSDSEFVQDGPRLWINHSFEVHAFNWHRKGDYFSSVCPQGNSKAVLIHKLSTKSTQRPFRKKPGDVQVVEFHPSKPIFFLATKRHVRVYDLQRQRLLKTLQPGVKWVSSISVHPGGDNLIIGSYDRRVCWFDLDFSTRPYKILRYHHDAVRMVHIHPRFPLFASCSDDGKTHIFHQTVYSDLLMNALIVPVKILKGHERVNTIGVTDCKWHPTEPWIFTAGADGCIYLHT